MILFPDIQFFLFIPFYLLAVFLAFFIPGDILTRKLFSQKLIYRLTGGFTLGLSFWVIQALILGYFQLRDLTYLYLTLTTLYWFKTNKLKLPPLSNIHLPDPLSLLIVTLGGLLMISAVWLIGYRSGSEIVFCCRSVPDSIYHIALVDNLTKNFPPVEPGSAGIVVKNYHYLSNLVLAELVRVFHLPLIPTIYQYSSILIVFLSAVTVASFTQILNLGKNYQRWLLFFYFFAGDLIYLLILWQNKTLNLTFSYLDDVTKLLTSPSRSLSVVIFFGLLTFLVSWIKSQSWKLGLLIGIVAGTLVGFKIYTAVIVYVGLTVLTLFIFIQNRSWRAFIPLLVAALIALAVYLPVNSGAGGLFFNGNWRLEDFIVKNEFNLKNLEFGRQFLFTNGNLPKVWLIQVLYLIIFVFFVLGTINISFLQGRKSLARFPLGLHLYLIPGILTALVLGIYSMQNIAPANTIQFLITLYSVGGIYAALSLDTYISSKKRVTKTILALLVIAVITFTALRSVNEGLGNIFAYKDREKVILTSQELEAANYLKNNTPVNSLILLDPEMSLQASSMYLSFLANKNLFLAGTSDHGVNGLEARINLTQNEVTVEQLKAHGIDFVYLTKPAPKYPILQSVFSNEAGTIYKVNQD